MYHNTYPESVGIFNIGDLVLVKSLPYVISTFTQLWADEKLIGTNAVISATNVVGISFPEHLVLDTTANREIAKIMENEWEKVFGYPYRSDQFTIFLAKVCQDPLVELKEFHEYLNNTNMATGVSFKGCEQIFHVFNKKTTLGWFSLL